MRFCMTVGSNIKFETTLCVLDLKVYKDTMTIGVKGGSNYQKMWTSN
jgi:hypothetical protein